MSPTLNWSQFIGQYHLEHPGATEALLAPSRNSTGIDPYTWIRAGIDMHQRVLDLACGSAPLRTHYENSWIGIDRSIAELTGARHWGAMNLLLADAAELPVSSGQIQVVVASMALMLFAPIDQVLAEVHRVLAPNGVLVALMPVTAPLTVRDRARYLALYRTLRMTARLPHSPMRRHAARTLHRSGFAVLSDERMRFAYPINDEMAGDQLVDGLYLPQVNPGRVTAAKHRTHTWIGSAIGIALRKIVAARLPTPHQRPAGARSSEREGRVQPYEQ